MRRLIKTELHKLLPFKTFWVISGLYAILLPTVFYAASQIDYSMNGMETTNMVLAPIYQLPHVWHTLAYLAGYFNILMGIFMIINLTNEFQYRTWRQHVIDGLSRGEIVLGKYLTAFGLSVAMAVYTGLAAAIFGGIYTSDLGAQSFFQNSEVLAAYGIQAFGYLSLAILFGLMFQRAGLAIVLYLLYVLILEGIVGLMLPIEIANWLPLETIKSTVPFPVSTSNINSDGGFEGLLMTGQNLFNGSFWAGLGYSILFGILALGIFSKKDL